MIVALTVLVLSFGLLALVLRRLTAIPIANINSEWLDRFDAGRYAVLCCLLAEEDVEFLRRSGMSARQRREFMAGRRRVFRTYLRHLRADYGRLQHLGRLMVLHAETDRPELARELLRQNLKFRAALVRVEASLLAHCLGLGAVDAAGLLRPLETLRAALATPLEPSASPVQA